MTNFSAFDAVNRQFNIKFNKGSGIKKQKKSTSPNSTQPSNSPQHHNIALEQITKKIKFITEPPRNILFKGEMFMSIDNITSHQTELASLTMQQKELMKKIAEHTINDSDCFAETLKTLEKSELHILQQCLEESIQSGLYHAPHLLEEANKQLNLIKSLLPSHEEVPGLYDFLTELTSGNVD